MQPEKLPYSKAKKNIVELEAVKTPADQIAVYPHQRVGEIVLLALIGGIVGAKVFNTQETWQDFIQELVGNLISTCGLTFYGGLIVAARLILYYLWKHKVGVIHFAMPLCGHCCWPHRVCFEIGLKI